MQIAVIGTGYVGLVTGACFAEFGNHVTCVDKDTRKIEMLADGRVPIYEPSLDSIVTKNMKEGRLRFTTDIREAVEKALIVFLAVGTPPASRESSKRIGPRSLPSRSSRTPNFCAKERQSMTSCGPTASSSAAMTK